MLRILELPADKNEKWYRIEKGLDRMWICAQERLTPGSVNNVTRQESYVSNPSVQVSSKATTSIAVHMAGV